MMDVSGTPNGPRPSALTLAAPPRRANGLAKVLDIERTWGGAPQVATDTLDRFESAIAFAIREAARLQHEPESGRASVSRIEVAEP
jgi:hypothetical protein